MLKKMIWFLLLVLLSVSALAAVNVNIATLQELQSVKGIGETKAKAIIEYRSKQGPFNTIDDLAQVPGIKAATLNKIRSEIKVEGESDTPTKQSKKRNRAAEQ